ncbi:MAG TPA: hypothetical protein VK709_20635 [Candidatus Saccharimonadales bacterium]|jgi:hypothetical protein|nr:hypothetical protein [Candidatus Saccharimonadales bacterium]
MNKGFFVVTTAILLFGSIVLSQVSYFPTNSLDESLSSSQFKEKWYSKQLSGLHETSLWQASKATEQIQVYRFLYLRSFHHPIVVRVDVSKDGKGLLTTKIGSGSGGNEPGHLIMNKTRRMSAQETSWFVNRIDELGFWQMPTIEKTDTIGVDGSQWILEGVKNGKYLVVDRWSPQTGPLKGLGTLMMFDLAKIKLLYQDVY